MKFKKSLYVLLGAALFTTACNDINEMRPEGGSQLAEQVQETNEIVPSMTEATFENMFNMMGRAYQTSSSRADDFAFIMAAISLDFEGADFMMDDNGYCWFSICGEYSSRNASYANPYIRYVIPYRHIGACNEVIAMYPEDTDKQEQIYQIAQARAMRAFDYLALAPYFQFNIQQAADQPCVPIIRDGVDYGNNPRATVKEVFDFIMEDLNYAVENLKGFQRPNKTQIDQQVAYGLRARANLIMGNFAEAAADADAAMAGYTPAYYAEVSQPSFCNLNEHNWIWGILTTDDNARNYYYATPSSWVCAFTGDGYAPATGNTPRINKLLYDKIPASDVRKGWWLDEDKHSPNWASLSWSGATGDAIADLVTDDGSKIELEPYTNIKFAQKSGVGNVLNNNDWPLMRVEEMILVKAEGLAKSGKEAEAKSVLTNFVSKYRDASYSVDAGKRTLADEIWFQRRVELWGEGFFVGDARRLNKPIVRTHGKGTTNWPANWAFNIPADDAYLNMRFPQREKDTNAGIVDNEGGNQPDPNTPHAELRDGVTD